MLDYFFKKEDIENFIFVRYYDIKREQLLDTIAFKIDEVSYFDLWNKNEFIFSAIEYSKPLREYVRTEHGKITKYKAQKLAKNFKHNFYDYVETQEDLYSTDPNRLRYKVAHPKEKEVETFVLSEDDYVIKY